MNTRITRQQFDKMLADPALDLNPTARGILQAYAQHMNYGDKPVSAYKTKAQAGTHAGVGKDQASKHIDALVEDGFLIDSGDTAPGPNRKPMPKYYLGRGVPTHSLIMRPKGRNPKNLVEDNSEPLDVDSVTTPNDSELTTPNDEEPTPNDEGVNSERFGTNNPLNNPRSNPSSNQEGADAPKPGIDDAVAHGSDYLVGTTENFQNDEDSPYPVGTTETDEPSLSPRAEETPTPNDSELSYRELAKAGGFDFEYDSYLKIPGWTEKKAYQSAKKQHERNMS